MNTLPKTLIITTLILSTPTVIADVNNIPGVKSIETGEHSTHLVTCANDTTGVISHEENNICVFSAENQKNRCDTSDNWKVEKAAEYICAAE